MKKLSLLLFALLLCGTQLCVALPGDYLQTCTQCDVKPASSGEQVLSCQCKQQNGFNNATTLWNPDKCAYIVNNNGTLACTTPPPSQQTEPEHRHRHRHKHHHRLPAGNYHETCNNCTHNNGVLRCACQRRDQSWNQNAIFDGHCNGTLSNQDGNLVCQ